MSDVARSAAATRFVWLNVLGGLAVLASYALGFAMLGEDVAQAWGGVPDSLRPWYTRSMLLAAAGYFPMTLYVLRSLRRPGATGRSGSLLARYAVPLYTGILAGSAIWMPLTARMIREPDALRWLLIRVDLAVVGLCSLLVLFLLLRQRPSNGRAALVAAQIGAAAFCVQTALLDATIWPAYFVF